MELNRRTFIKTAGSAVAATAVAGMASAALAEEPPADEAAPAQAEETADEPAADWHEPPAEVTEFAQENRLRRRGVRPRLCRHHLLPRARRGGRERLPHREAGGGVVQRRGQRVRVPELRHPQGARRTGDRPGRLLPELHEDHRQPAQPRARHEVRPELRRGHQLVPLRPHRRRLRHDDHGVLPQDRAPDGRALRHQVLAERVLVLR